MKNVIRTLTVVCYLQPICLNCFGKYLILEVRTLVLNSDAIKPVKSASGCELICAPLLDSQNNRICLTSKYAGTRVEESGSFNSNHHIGVILYSRHFWPGFIGILAIFAHANCVACPCSDSNM
jgi:hypothetical protein